MWSWKFDILKVHSPGGASKSGDGRRWREAGLLSREPKPPGDEQTDRFEGSGASVLEEMPFLPATSPGTSK